MGSFIVVDDDFSMRYLMQMTLKYAGHNVIADVDNATSAMNYLKNGRVPDVILLDVVLPGGPGYGIIDYIRANHKAVKIAMCTGLNEEKVMQLIPPAKYDLYIQKPFKSEEFVSKLSAMLPAGPVAPGPEGVAAKD